MGKYDFMGDFLKWKLQNEPVDLRVVKNPSKPWFKSLGCALALCLGACSAPTFTLPLTMPSYDAETVNSHYIGIIQHETLYYQIMRLMADGHVPEAKKAQADKALDRYLYWASVAKIYSFHYRWEESDMADQKSEDALLELIKIIQTDAI